jgi:beta-mannanase
MLKSSPEKILLGFYLPDIPPKREGLCRFENLICREIDIVSFYWSWGLGKSEVPFFWIDSILNGGKIPLVTWEPWVPPNDYKYPANSIEDPNFNLNKITRGYFDDYIYFWTNSLKKIDGKIYLRPMHEMNGNWYPWCGTTNSNHPEEYILAWQHIHEVFKNEDVTNVEWVWCPYALPVPNTVDNSIFGYYPGDDYVDWLALDGYNWGNTRPWSHWQEFNDIFHGPYKTILNLSSKPIMVSEIGCTESGGSKAMWISEAYKVIEEYYTSIRAVVWFNVQKECDWRIESSKESLSSFRKVWRYG